MRPYGPISTKSRAPGSILGCSSELQLGFNLGWVLPFGLEFNIRKTIPEEPIQNSWALAPSFLYELGDMYGLVQEKREKKYKNVVELNYLNIKIKSITQNLLSNMFS